MMRDILVTGPENSGKSTLVRALISPPHSLPFADDIEIASTDGFDLHTMSAVPPLRLYDFTNKLPHLKILRDIFLQQYTDNLKAHLFVIDAVELLNDLQTLMLTCKEHFSAFTFGHKTPMTILVINKIDQIPEAKKFSLQAYAKDLAQALKITDIKFVSAKTKQNTAEMIQLLQLQVVVGIERFGSPIYAAEDAQSHTNPLTEQLLPEKYLKKTWQEKAMACCACLFNRSSRKKRDEDLELTQITGYAPPSWTDPTP